MRTPSEFNLQQLAHIYDPVKAHEYYLKTRKLKGRKGAAKTEKSKFVSNLNYVLEGGNRKVAAQLVKWAQGKSDDEIKTKIREIRSKHGDADATMASTLQQVLDHRTQVRTQKSKQPKVKSETKAKQRQALQAQVQNLENKLRKLEDLIRKRLREEAAEDRKGKAKKERAAKEADKPKSAAEKAKIARENEKYRDKHKQKLKTEAKKTSGSSSSSTTTKDKDSGPTSADLKVLATKVKGQIAVAKQKLAAL